MSSRLVPKCEWRVYDSGTLGSDHFPVLSKLNVDVPRVTGDGNGRWVFSKANWTQFRELGNLYLSLVKEGNDIEKFETDIRQSIYLSARAAIPKNTGKGKRKAVPWWSEQCEEAIKNRNRAFKVLKRTHHFQHLIDYKQFQAVVRRTIRQTKRTYWREYCSSIGNTTSVDQVWGMIKRMEGNRREWYYPILSDGGQVAISNAEKAEMMVNTLSKVHSSDNLSEEEKKGRADTRGRYADVIQRKDLAYDKYNIPFTMAELKGALAKCKKSTPGKDEVSYTMLKHLSDEGLQLLLNLYNKVWGKGRIPSGWKEAVIVPIQKPGKDASNPVNYRPIALTSHVGKLMERLINGRLVHFIEERELMANYQSGFRKGRSTTDSMLCLEDEIRKAQIKKDTVVAIFFDVEKAYDMLWVDGLLIKKRHMLGIQGNV